MAVDNLKKYGINVEELGEDNSFSNMDEEELSILVQLLEMELANKESRLVAKQIKPIVPIEEWINSTYYAGPDIVGLYDYWKELVIKIFKNPNSVNTVIASGAIGVGKTTVGKVIKTRKLYELSCYKNIPAMFDLMSTSHITFLYFSVNKTQAEHGGFGEFRSHIDTIQYFREEFPRDKRINSLLVFPENVIMSYGSSSSDAIGLHVIMNELDEANFYQGAATKASDLYSSIVGRSKSRFLKRGIDYSLNLILSSSTTESSFTEDMKRVYSEKSNAVVVSPTLWEVNPKEFAGPPWFYVFKGNKTIEPFIVKDLVDVSQVIQSEGLTDASIEIVEDSYTNIDNLINASPEHIKVLFLKVPEKLREPFDVNVIKALQDMGGVSVAPSGRLFNSEPVYVRSIKSWLNHPFVKDLLEISTGDGITIQDYLKPGFVFKNKELPHFIHVDQSYRTDRTGLAMCHIDRLEKRNGLDIPIIQIDFKLGLTPPKPPRKIAIYKVRDFIVFLRDIMGVNIELVTYDFFNSQESSQILEELGFNVGYLSVDKTDEAYLNYITLLYEERLEQYEHALAKKELFNVIHDRERRKVDHPKVNPDGTVGCFDGRTKIKLVNGSNIEIQKLVGHSGFWVFGYHEGSTVIVEVKSVFISKYVNKMCSIMLGSGDIIRCTHEHLFMLSDGSYKEAGMLNSDDVLMSFSCVGDLRYKVMAVQTILLDKDTPVYDMEVPDTSNFLLSAGVFVHNSKDIMDAEAGCVTNALKANISNAVGNKRTIDSFLFINGGGIINRLPQPSGKPRSSVDNLIDRMLSEYEM